MFPARRLHVDREMVRASQLTKAQANLSITADRGELAGVHHSLLLMKLEKVMDACCRPNWELRYSGTEVH